jgi:two-component system CheB/CheR fusion protein
MYGWNEAEALKMNISNIVPEDRKEEELNIIKKLSQSEVLEPYRTQRLNKDGRIMNVWLTASSLVDKNDNIYAIATTEKEIKEQSKQEKP